MRKKRASSDKPQILFVLSVHACPLIHTSSIFFKGVVCVKNIWVIRYKVRNHRMKNYIGCKIGIRGMFIKNL